MFSRGGSLLLLLMLTAALLVTSSHSEGNPVKWALLADVAWRSHTPSSSGMVADIDAWVRAYALRRYPSSTSVAANTHVATAWSMLLFSAYGGNRTLLAAPDLAASEAVDDLATTGMLNARLLFLNSTSSSSSSSARGNSGLQPQLRSTTPGRLGSHDSDIFSKDGLARFPSFSLELYKSPNVSGVASAWAELLAAAEVDPSMANGAAFRYDLVDVARQALQNLFANTFAALQAVCAGRAGSDSGTSAAQPSSSTATARVDTGNYTEYVNANCRGQCLPPNPDKQPNGGNCDRMPGCGHDAGLKPCGVGAMKARCNAARPYMGVNCTAFSTNGYLFHGEGYTPFHAYPLTCYVLNGPPAPPPPPPPPPPNLHDCAIALQTGNSGSMRTSSNDVASMTGAAVVMALGADLDRILLTDKHFLMKSWIEAAKAFGNTTDERVWLEWNARAQVTSWGSIESNQNEIADYASKQWGGLVGSYHMPLWQHFFSRMHAAAAAGTQPTNVQLASKVLNELNTMGAAWTNSTAEVPGLSAENTVDVARELFEKWKPMM